MLRMESTMKVLLKSLGFRTGDALRQHTIRRLTAALAHWADRLERVVVRFADANGPKGGVDKACSIHLSVQARDPLVVTAVSSDYYSAVDLAIRRAGRVAAHTFDRRAF